MTAGRFIGAQIIPEEKCEADIRATARAPTSGRRATVHGVFAGVVGVASLAGGGLYGSWIPVLIDGVTPWAPMTAREYPSGTKIAARPPHPIAAGGRELFSRYARSLAVSTSSSWS
jgi:hypothetical protein